MAFPLLTAATALRARLGSRLLALVLALSLVSVAACGNDAGEETVEAHEDTSLRMGEPITDSTLAAIAIAEHGSDTLTADEFNAQITRVMQQFPQVQGDEQQARELRRSLVEQFAVSHALAGEVAARGITAEEGELNEQLEQIRERFESQEEFEQALAEQDLTIEELRTSMREQLEQQRWQQNIVEATEEPTEQEVEEFREDQAEQVRVQHVLFFSPSPDSVLERRAEAVLDSAKAGVDFAELARRHSDDGTAEQGGDLDYFSRGEMVEPFSEAAFALSDSGDIADDVVRTQFGYHIIRLTGRRTGELMETEQARQTMVRRRQQEAVMSEIDRLRGEVTVRVNPDVVDADFGESSGIGDR